MTSEQRPDLEPDELERQAATALPDREEMSVIIPTGAPQIISDPYGTPDLTPIPTDGPHMISDPHGPVPPTTTSTS